MDWKGTEPGTVRVSEIVDDELREVGIVRPLQPLQQIPTPIWIERLTDKPIEGSVLEVIEVREPRQGVLSQPFARKQPRIQLARQVRLRPNRLPLMIEFELQMPAKELERTLRIPVIGEQDLPLLDFD